MHVESRHCDKIKIFKCDRITSLKISIENFLNFQRVNKFNNLRNLEIFDIDSDAIDKADKRKKKVNF